MDSMTGGFSSNSRRNPAQDRAEIEAEAVDVHLDHPVAQAVLNEAAHDRVVAVEGVAAAGIVLYRRLSASSM
jgi:hypothetical protein